MQKDDIRIGGVGPDGTSYVVEVDETKMGKRKYNKGRKVKGVWVVVAVCRQVSIIWNFIEQAL
jgi:hypothetical protein